MTSAFETICAYLDKKRDAIQEEITSTPPPIPACDAHFNHLLEQRARICDELNRIRQVADNPASEESIRLIAAFLDSSRYIDDGAKHAIRCALRNTNAEKH